jgi:preprotein translocase subunit Sec63
VGNCECGVKEVTFLTLGPHSPFPIPYSPLPNFLRSLHVALRRPETMKRESAMRFRMCGKMGQDERWSEVVSYLSFNSLRSLSRVAQTSPKLSLRQAPEER